MMSLFSLMVCGDTWRFANSQNVFDRISSGQRYRYILLMLLSIPTHPSTFVVLLHLFHSYSVRILSIFFLLCLFIFSLWLSLFLFTILLVPFFPIFIYHNPSSLFSFALLHFLLHITLWDWKVSNFILISLNFIFIVIVIILFIAFFFYI